LDHARAVEEAEKPAGVVADLKRMVASGVCVSGTLSTGIHGAQQSDLGTKCNRVQQ
jgi:hypothetical protein